jgi:hypothetical protein
MFKKNCERGFQQIKQLEGKLKMLETNKQKTAKLKAVYGYPMPAFSEKGSLEPAK